MGDDIFRIGDAAEQRAKAVEETIAAIVQRTYRAAQLVWSNLGISERDADNRTTAFIDCFKSTADRIRKGEARVEADAKEHNHNLAGEIDELYSELGIDNSENHANIQPNDTILELKTKLEREFERLIARKDEMLEGIRALKQREEALCAELEASPLDISPERVPTERDMHELRSRVEFLESEKVSRAGTLAEMRGKISELWDQLGESANDSFQFDLRDEALSLSKENVSRAQQLYADLSAKVRERSDKLEERRNEIELLWSRLDYNGFHVQVFREKHFGIKAEQFLAMETELVRLREEKTEKLGEFIDHVRQEIRDLGEKLMYGSETFAELESFMPADDVSQEKLNALERLAEKMREELESRATLLRKVQKWQALINDHHRVEAESKDPNRLKNRGGGLLALQKESAKLAKVIPDMFSKLRQEVFDWEIANEVEFKVRDQRFTHMMESDFFGTSLGPKPRVPVGSVSTGKRKQAPSAHQGMSQSKLFKRNDGTTAPSGPTNAPYPDATLESVPDFAAFRTGIDSASKAQHMRRRSPRLGNRLKHAGAGLQALSRPGAVLRAVGASPMRGPNQRAPLNELTSSPVVNHLTSTQVESPSKRYQFPRVGDVGSRNV